MPPVLKARRLVALAACCLHGLLATQEAPAAAPRHLTVQAGSHPRTNTPVAFPFRPDTSPNDWYLSGPRGLRLPVQVDLPSGLAWYLEPGLAPGASRRYRLRRSSTALIPAPGTRLAQTGQNLLLQVGASPAANFVAGPGHFPRAGIRPEYLRGGYLHPLTTPSGRTVTDDYPANHIHHHGIWTAWTRTRFEGRAPDFWNMGERKGRTDFESLLASDSGPVFSGFRASILSTDLLTDPPRPALREQWSVRTYAVAGDGTGRARFHLLDLDSHHDCTGTSPVELPKYYYGGLGYRGPMAWNGPGSSALYLDSNGTTNRVTANESRVRWHWLGGPVDGAVVGLAQLGHPENFRAPQPVRIHPTEPFTCWAPSQAGDWAIRPGGTYRARYRLVILDGPPDPALLERLWSDYAHPPVVRVE